jgi:hypothetical protein
LISKAEGRIPNYIIGIAVLGRRSARLTASIADTEAASRLLNELCDNSEEDKLLL